MCVFIIVFVYVYMHMCACVWVYIHICGPVSLSVSVCLHMCYFLLFCMQKGIVRFRIEFANRDLDIHNF